MESVIPPKKNRKEHRDYDKCLYKLRNLVENCFLDIPWAKISGLRHRLVNGDDNTNWSLICTVIFNVLPDFLKLVEAIEPPEDG